MRYIALIAALLLSACVTTTQKSGTPRPPANNEYPADVTKFIEERDGCEHFIGEEPYDEDRRMVLAKNITELCTGSDEKLEALRTKYQNNPKVRMRLSQYEPL